MNVVTFGASPTYQPTTGGRGGVVVAGDSKKAGVRTGSA